MHLRRDLSVEYDTFMSFLYQFHLYVELGTIRQSSAPILGPTRLLVIFSLSSTKLEAKSHKKGMRDIIIYH